MPNGPGWSVNDAVFEFSMSLTAIVFLSGGATASSGALAAFVGNEVRGVGTAKSVPFGAYMGNTSWSMLVYSNNARGEIITFKFWDGSTEWAHPESIAFVDNALVGSAVAPLVLTIAVTLVVALSERWTWFSINVNPASWDINDVLSSISTTSTSQDTIKSSTVFSSFYAGYGWFGSLETLKPTEMYKIKRANVGQLTLTGSPVPLNTPIILDIGWNWLPFLPQAAQSMPGAMAMHSGGYSQGDFLKSQSVFTTYYAVSSRGTPQTPYLPTFPRSHNLP